MRFWLHLKLCYILSVMAVFLTMKTNSWSGIADSNWRCHPQIQTHRLVLSICTYHQTVAFINLLIAVLTLTLYSWLLSYRLVISCQHPADLQHLVQSSTHSFILEPATCVSRSVYAYVSETGKCCWQTVLVLRSVLSSYHILHDKPRFEFSGRTSSLLCS